MSTKNETSIPIPLKSLQKLDLLNRNRSCEFYVRKQETKVKVIIRHINIEKTVLLS